MGLASDAHSILKLLQASDLGENKMLKSNIWNVGFKGRLKSFGTIVFRTEPLDLRALGFKTCPSPGLRGPCGPYVLCALLVQKKEASFRTWPHPLKVTIGKNKLHYKGAYVFLLYHHSGLRDRTQSTRHGHE